MGKKSFNSPDLDFFQSVMAEARAGFEPIADKRVGA